MRVKYIGFDDKIPLTRLRIYDVLGTFRLVNEKIYIIKNDNNRQKMYNIKLFTTIKKHRLNILKSI